MEPRSTIDRGNNDSEPKGLVVEGENHSSSTNSHKKRNTWTVTSRSILVLIIFLVIGAGILLFKSLRYQNFPTKYMTLGLALLCCTIVWIIGNKMAIPSRIYIGRRTGLVAVISVLILGLTLMAFGWHHLGIRSDPLLRHRKILALQGGIEQEFFPEQFGVTNQDIDRILLPLWRVYPSSPNYWVIWKSLQDQCAEDTSINLSDKLLDKGIIFLAVIDDFAYGRWTATSIIAGLLCILLAELLWLITWKSARHSKS
ncbi:MAG: hypothetical protein MUO72_10160 [Bacteroidales bacterium]|nr:hypothetical protein [Bacteroidales bacterium]